jgi:hypothetical protein
MRPSLWLACLEITAGLSLGLYGAVSSLATDESLAGIGAVVALLLAPTVLVIPGVLLFSRHRLRWLGQLIPISVALWLLLKQAHGLAR